MDRDRLRGRNNSGLGKVSAVARRIARHKQQALSLGIGTNVEIGQGRGLRTTTAAIFYKSLRGQTTCGVRKQKASKNFRVKPEIQILSRCKCRGEFRVDNRIYAYRSSKRCQAELTFRPFAQDRIGRGNIQQHICIQKCHPSHRVHFMISSVLTRGTAAPFARFNQFSKPGALDRLWRKCSNQ
jgi:hypothetical protein